MRLKKSLSVFVGIPNLANDEYSAYIGSVLNHLDRQETSVEIMTPYITPPHAGTFHQGQRDRLDAIVGRMNNIVDKFMTTNATHLFINDGDVEVPSNCIDTLIRHNVDVVSGVYPFKNWRDCRAMCFGRMEPKSPCGNMHPRDWDYMKGRVWGENEAWSGGTGCCLIKRRVFKRLHPRFPPLRFNRDNNCGMDMFFWKRVQDAGFTARVDANIVCGHRGPEGRNYPLSKIGEWLR